MAPRRSKDRKAEANVKEEEDDEEVLSDTESEVLAEESGRQKKRRRRGRPRKAVNAAAESERVKPEHPEEKHGIKEDQDDEDQVRTGQLEQEVHEGEASNEEEVAVEEKANGVRTSARRKDAVFVDGASGPREQKKEEAVPKNRKTRRMRQQPQQVTKDSPDLQSDLKFFCRKNHRRKGTPIRAAPSCV
ncbi:hypothetical protein KP509_19G040000 [Ceratopteris richardii]|uniref:Uncharacterized protein n=1 Tax=Ceratopteris richardii TaxID=49495 RepID=A0A8T2SNS2_CERRI|nr:hypothetical protein KP509_19G040000 [Ceratopteris richardii]